MFSRVASSLAICLALATFCLAAPKDSGAPAEAAVANEDSPKAKFAALHRQWKELIAKLTQMRERYQTDTGADKKVLEAQFTSALEEAKALAPKLTDVAEAAYLATPNKDPEVNDFLIGNLRGLVAADDYEPAAKLAKILVDNGFAAPDLPVWAGLSFYATHDFDNAGKYMKLASEQPGDPRDGALENSRRTLKRFLPTVDKCKELWEKEQQIRAKEEKANNLPKVKLTTTKGDIVVELFENEAPIATANFISLVEKKHYDGLTFHRVLPGFMAQAGDPKGDGSGGPGYTIPDECYQDNYRNHFRGSLSMAKTAEKDSGGSQFFLTFLPTGYLDGKHTVFGRVVEGLDVLAKLLRFQPGDPGTPDKILKATVLSKRKHKYEFVKRLDKAK